MWGAGPGDNLLLQYISCDFRHPIPSHSRDRPLQHIGGFGVATVHGAPTLQPLICPGLGSGWRWRSTQCSCTPPSIMPHFWCSVHRALNFFSFDLVAVFLFHMCYFMIPSQGHRFDFPAGAFPACVMTAACGPQCGNSTHLGSYLWAFSALSPGVSQLTPSSFPSFVKPLVTFRCSPMASQSCQLSQALSYEELGLGFIQSLHK